MTLRIQCPACERQFKVSEELKGRTVECGACEHRFKLDDSVTVARKDKFYPGEKRVPGLDAIGRSQRAVGAPVRFETAAYNQTQSIADFVPMSPQRLVATIVGTLILLGAIVLLVLGTQPHGVLKDMEIDKRAILAGFLALVGGALVLFGCTHRLRSGIAITVLGVGITMALAFLMPVPRTIDPGLGLDAADGGGTADPAEPEADPREPQQPMTLEEVMEAAGYGPVQRAIAVHVKAGSDTDPAEFVAAIWVPVMEERFKFQIQNYLQRKSGSDERPSFYRREEGGLFVIDGPRLPMDRVEAMAERFGVVKETYPEIRLLEVALDASRLLGVSKEQMGKLTDKNHPAFYAVNLGELEHIDLDRVSEAVRRLADAEPLRFRVEISRRLVELLGEESESEFKGDVCRALLVWSEDGDGAEQAVAIAAKEVLGRGETMPRPMLEFMVSRKSPEAVPILEVLWMEDPTAWEPIIAEIGPAAEDAVLKHLDDEDAGVRISAVQLLKRVGTKKCVEPLRALLPSADDEMKVRIQEVIDSL